MAADVARRGPRNRATAAEYAQRKYDERLATARDDGDEDLVKGLETLGYDSGFLTPPTGAETMNAAIRAAHRGIAHDAVTRSMIEHSRRATTGNLRREKVQVR
jgi:hypothetical protein